MIKKSSQKGYKTLPATRHGGSIMLPELDTDFELINRPEMETEEEMGGWECSPTPSDLD